MRASTKFLAVAVIGLSCLGTSVTSQAPDPPDIAPLEDGKLYLNVGTIDTRDAPGVPLSGPFTRGKAYILQLDGEMTPESRRALRAAGVEIYDFIPKNAFIVGLDDADSVALATMPDVRWLGEVERSWKLEPQFGEREWSTEERQEMAARGEHGVLIVLFQGRELDRVLDVIETMPGATVHYTEEVGGNQTISATLQRSQVDVLLARDDVQWIEEASEITFRNNSNRWIVQSNATNVTPFYNNGLRGESQIIGLIDGAPDQDHCSLDGGKILSYNAPDGNSSHGTHVACTAAGDNGANADTRGVAYLANLVIDTTPAFTEVGIEAVLNQHHGQGARIHTNSWGDDGTTSYNGLSRGFDDFLWQNETSFVALAATNTNSLKNPENAKNLLAVGASQDTPNQGNFCSGGTGPTADGRRKPEAFAPGCGTDSAIPSVCSTAPKTGTSMATPAIAGLATLFRQYYVSGYYPTGVATPADAITPSGALIKASILNSAVDMTGIAGYPSPQEGWGRVLGDNTAYFSGDARDLIVLADIRNAFGLNSSGLNSYTLNVLGSGQRLNITLVYTDAPASASTGTGFARVNDLDLEVIGPGGAFYRGNVFSGGVSVTGGSKDDRNNVEQVQLAAPTTGVWTVRVRGASVNVGSQGYALVVSGDVSTETVCGDGVISGSETCEPPGGLGQCDCCVVDPAGNPGCSYFPCESAVCAADSFCCDVNWDDICANAATTNPACIDCCSTPCDCCEANGTPGCSDTTCQSLVCAIDSFCCNTEWDGVCAEEALDFPECVECCGGLCNFDTCTYCGDGATNGGGEECDDGNLNNDDGCTNECIKIPFCGDDFIDIGETCDPPGAFGCDCCEANGTPGCSDTTCQSAVCAIDAFCCATTWDSTCVNEALTFPECVDCCIPDPPAPFGSDCCEINGSPGCSDPACAAAVCAIDSFCCTTSWDGICAGEALDESACVVSCLPAGDCRVDCTFCGDTKLDAGEACDDGNNVNGDGCDSACQYEFVCGDGVIVPGETCEPPGPFNCDCCEVNGSTGCTNPICEALVCAADSFCCNTNWDTACVNGALGFVECRDCCLPDPPAPYGCDCLDSSGGSGCSDASCEAAVCADDPFCCDVTWDSICASEALGLTECVLGCLPVQDCRANCTYCGDGVTDAGEGCDDGNNVGGDGCRFDCTVEFCGDGIIDPQEQCDPPGPLTSTCNCCNANGGLGCEDAQCQAAVCAFDSFCCNTAWDGVCANEALNEPACEPCCGIDECSGSCCLDSDGDGVCNDVDSCPNGPNPGGGPGLFGRTVLGGASAACDCCVSNGTPGCTNAACEALVCADDSFCCNTSWDGICASEAPAFPECASCCKQANFNWPTALNYDWVHGGFEGSTDIGGYSPDTIGGGFGTSLSDATFVDSGTGRWYLFAPDCPDHSWSSGGPAEIACGPPSDCCVNNGTPGCSEPICQGIICALDPFCCNVSWDGTCALEANAEPLCVNGCNGALCREALP